MQAGAGEDLGGLDFAKGRTEDLEASDDVAHEVRELTDGLAKLHQRGRAIFIDSLQPGSDRVGFDEERAGSLGE